MRKAMMIEFEAVDWSYGKQRVFTALNLKIDEGKYCALAGANGAGKSTLIQLLLGLLLPQQGSIRVFGDLARRDAARLQWVYLPERFQLSRAVCGQDYLDLIAGLYRLPKPQGYVAELCEELEFKSADLRRPVKSYSKGMMQKLGLIGCLLPEPKLMVLDEPLSGLDPRARVRLKQALLRRQKRGMSVFYSTHLLTDAAEVCNDLVILEQGQVLFHGSPEQCMQRYQAHNLEQAYMQALEPTSETAVDP